MIRPEKLKKYQREKFNNFKKINELKIDDDEAYIELKVDKFSNIVSEYSLSDTPILKNEFLNIIESCASFIPLEYPLVLEIHNNTFTSSERILIRKFIKNHFNLIKVTKEMELKALKRKSYFFLTLGILMFLIVGIITAYAVLPFTHEILSFMASFSIWEFGELLFFEQDDLKEQVIKYSHLSTIRVLYDKDNVKK